MAAARGPVRGFYQDYSTKRLTRSDSETSLEERAERLKQMGNLRKLDEQIPDTFLGRLVFNPHFETFGGFVVLSNFAIMTMETHATATDDGNVMDFVTFANKTLLSYYTTELLLRLWVLRRSFFTAGWNLLDFIIVITGWISEALEAFSVTGGLDQMSMLKSLRMLRLLRLVRLFVAFRELYVLVAGIGRCMKTLFWASGLIFIVLNVWAILSVEFLNEKVKELAISDAFGTCSWCEFAFSNIWLANLTWFQVISTSDWTAIGRPLAEEFTWPYAFFVINVYVVIWGLLNLIVAAIVDANIAARDDDVAIAAQIRDQSYLHAWQSFEKICKDMDEDGSGDVTVKEFKHFLQQNLELQQHLQVMGIREQDINDLLLFIDVDGSGSVTSEEFIEQFTAMRTLVEKTSIFFLLRYCQRIEKRLSEIGPLAKSLHASMSAMESSYVEKQAFEQKFEKPTSEPYRTQSPSLTPREPVFLPEALKKAAHTPTTSHELQMPCVDLKRLPAGWYYIGGSNPSEASVWCRTEDVNGEVVHTSNFCATRLDGDDTKDATVTTDGQRWEPLKPNTFHVHYAKHVYVKAPISDRQFPPEIIQSMASIDRLIDSICSEVGTQAAPVTTEGKRWQPLSSNSIRFHHAKHIYVRAPIVDVQLPPHVVDALASADKLLDSTYGERSAAVDELASERAPVHDVLSAIDRDSGFLQAVATPFTPRSTNSK